MEAVTILLENELNSQITNEGRGAEALAGAGGAGPKLALTTMTRWTSLDTLRTVMLAAVLVSNRSVIGACNDAAFALCFRCLRV